MCLEAEWDSNTAADPTVQILVVDDHEAARMAVRRLLEQNQRWVVCGEASDGQQAVEKAQRLQPDVIVMDLNMPRMNGLQAAERISHTVPHSRVLICTIHETGELVNRTAETEVWGIVDKLNAGRELTQAVDSIVHGHRYFPPEACGPGTGVLEPVS